MEKTLAHQQHTVTLDETTGQIRSIRDNHLDREILRFDPGQEVEINGKPLTVEPIKHEGHWGGLLSLFDLRNVHGYLAGARYELQRIVVPGGRGNHVGRTNAVHLRHVLYRKPWEPHEEYLDQLWGSPIEAPEMVQTMSLLCAPTPLLGPNTRMRAIAIGGSGPREHVSLEDGPIAEVKKWLQTKFRTAFPGQCSIPGAMYYNPGNEKWVWITCRHAHLGGHTEHTETGQRFHFGVYRQMNVHDRFVLPDLSIYYGQGMDEADKLMASFFDLYEEPPSWWFNTTWFWLHTFWQPNASFDKAKAMVDRMIDECGITGFGMSGHDLPLGGADCEARSVKGSPHLGGDEGLRRLTDHIRKRGGHTYMWVARYGKLGAGFPHQWQDDWAIYGIDGRPVGDHGPFRICDPCHPGYRQYLMDAVRHLVEYCGVDGLFWDSAFQPMLPNFSEASKGYLNMPGECSAGAPGLYEEIYRMGRKLHKDFFMWGEGVSSETPMNAFAVDNPKHGEHSGHALMHRLAHAGPRRLVWRSCWEQDVSGAFPFVRPQSDIHWNPDSDPRWDKLVGDPMNQWVCRTVAERGCRQARGIADGIGVLDEFIVVPNAKNLPTMDVTVPQELVKGQTLTHELNGRKVQGAAVDGGVRFELPETGPWKMG